MAPVYQSTPRKDGKTQAEADEAMAEHLNTYYVQEEEREERTIESSAPPPVPAKKKAKRPARDAQNQPSNAKTTFEPKSDEVQSSPATRKSARVAAKRRAANEPTVSNEDEMEQPPTKRQKLTLPEEDMRNQLLANVDIESPTSLPQTAGVKRRASESAVPDGDDEKQRALKKYKLSPFEKTPASSAKTSAPTLTKEFNSDDTAIGKDLPKAKYSARGSTTPDSVDQDESVETEPEEDEDDDGEETTTKGRKGKGKKPAAKAFQGTKSGFGTSIEAPEDATQQEPWKCANRDCNSGQTYHNRDGPHSYGRKVISNFFGRNKKETNLINPEVWHNYCRKCYQRGTYRVNSISSLEKVKFYVNNIEMQLDRIELWRPNATFTVQLSKGANSRLGKYYRELNRQGATAASAQAAVTKAPQTNSKGKNKPLPLEDGFPIDLMAYFEDNYSGTDQTFLDIKLILNWVTNLVENGQIDCMPPMEFLISKQADDEEDVVDPALNYDRWCAHEDGIEYEDEDAGEEGDDAGNDGEAPDDSGDRDEDPSGYGADEDDHAGDDAGPSGEGYDRTEYDGEEEDATDAAGSGTHDSEQGDYKHGQYGSSAYEQVYESSEESDEEMRYAMKYIHGQTMREAAQDAHSADTPPRSLNRDFYDEDNGETDEDDEDDEPTTPPLPRRKFQLTPTGRGGPILPNQASTYHVDRDGPSVDFSHLKKRKYQEEALAALLANKPVRNEYKYTGPGSNAGATTYTTPASSYRKLSDNYNDSSSENNGESSSKKSKLSL